MICVHLGWMMFGLLSILGLKMSFCLCQPATRHLSTLKTPSLAPLSHQSWHYGPRCFSCASWVTMIGVVEGTEQSWRNKRFCIFLVFSFCCGKAASQQLSQLPCATVVGCPSLLIRDSLQTVSEALAGWTVLLCQRGPLRGVGSGEVSKWLPVSVL